MDKVIAKYCAEHCRAECPDGVLCQEAQIHGLRHEVAYLNRQVYLLEKVSDDVISGLKKQNKNLLRAFHGFMKKLKDAEAMEDKQNKDYYGVVHRWANMIREKRSSTAFVSERIYAKDSLDGLGCVKHRNIDGGVVFCSELEHRLMHSREGI